MTVPGEPLTQRQRLGSELRQLRRLAGLSGQEMGQILGVSQRTISRFETAGSLPSLPQVRAWAEAAQAPASRQDHLLALAEAAVNEVVVYRDSLPAGLTGMQTSIGQLEATALTIRNFQPGIIPGLLQTADYARHTLQIGDVRNSGDYHAAAAARMRRQEILYQPGRAFEFLLTESALRWRPGPRDIVTAQLLQIASLATLDTITIGVIPADAAMRAITRCGFILYEDRQDDHDSVVLIETPHAAIYASDPADVSIYRKEITRFRESAITGDEAIAFIRGRAV